MASVRDVLDALERLAPTQYALPGDKVGLQVGSPEDDVSRVVVSLDRSIGAVRFAHEQGAQMLVSHHPLIFSPVHTVTGESHEGRTIIELIRSGIAFAAAHTNWDAARGGINDTLASVLGLNEVGDLRYFGESAPYTGLKLIFFCPEEDVQRVLDAVSEAGAGVIGAYRRCAFFTRGTGTFIGGKGTNPTIGEPGRTEEVVEIRVETVVPPKSRGAVEAALLRAHPYEEPAFDWVPMAPTDAMPLGRVGSLKEPVRFDEFVRQVDLALFTRSLAWGDPAKTIRKVAAVGGSADGEWRHAQQAGADVLVTGEVKQHVALEAEESGFAILSAGHYATENPGAMALADGLQKEMPEVQILRFEPEPGRSGRPL